MKIGKIIMALIVSIPLTTAAAPEVTDLHFNPSNPQAGDQVTVKVIGEDNGDFDLANAFLKKDSGNFKQKACQNNFDCSAKYTFTPDAGSHTFTAEVQETFGDDGEATRSDPHSETLKVDSPSKISIEWKIFPQEPTFVGNNYVFQAEATDPDSKLGGKYVEIIYRTWESSAWSDWKVAVSGYCSYDEDSECSTSTEFIPESDKKHEFRARVTESFGGGEVYQRTSARFITPEEKNQLPTIELRNPADGAEGISKRPEFRWFIQDPDDKSLQEVKLYVEKKDSQSDGPWNQEGHGKIYTVSRTTGEQISFKPAVGTGLRRSTTYVWGIKAKDSSEIWTRSKTRDFQTKDSEINSPVSKINLISPSDRAKVSQKPSFTFSATDPDGDKVDYKLVIKKGDQKPWRNPDFAFSYDNQPEGKKITRTPNLKLEKGSTYTWGLKADDDKGPVRRSEETRIFTVKTKESQLSTLKIRVTDSTTSKLLDARVQVDGVDRSKRTGSDGVAAFSNLNGNTYYTITVSKEGYFTQTKTRFLPKDSLKLVPFTLQPREEEEQVASIVDSGPSGSVNNPVNLFVRIDKSGSNYNCYWSRDSSVTRSDNQMNQVSGQRFESSQNFNQGKTVYFKCFRKSDGKSTNKASTSFTLDIDTQEPTARLSISPNPAKVNEQVTFDATGSTDPDGQITSYQFDINGDGNYEITDQDGIYKKTFNNPRTRNARAKVTDNQGNTATTTKFYEIESTEDRCKVNVGNLRLDSSNIQSDGSTTARVSVTNNGGSGQSLRVRFKADGNLVSAKTVTVSSGSYRTLTQQISASSDSENDGHINVKVIVDSRGAPCNGIIHFVDTRSLTVETGGVGDGQRPTARISISPNPAEVGQEVTFDATGSSDPDGQITSYQFDINGDGNYEITDQDGIYKKTFNNPRTRNARAKVTDNQGNTATTTKFYEIMSQDRNKGELKVTVKDEEGDTLEGATVTIDNGETSSESTEENGEAIFTQLDPDKYDVEATCNEYSETLENVEVQAGETTSRTINLDVDIESNECDGEKAHLTVNVEDINGNNLDNAEVRVENGDDETKLTDISGVAEFDLEPGDYNVEVSKTGFVTETKSIELEEGENKELEFQLGRTDEEDLVIENVNYPSSVCKGTSLNTQIKVSNRGKFHEMVTLTGNGLGSIIVGRSFTLEPGQTKTKNLRFTNVQGSGTEEFKITATNHDSDSTTKTVNVKQCPIEGGAGRATDISLSLSPREARINEPVKVSGFVDGVEGRKEVKIRVNGEVAAEVNTQPDGFYQTFITPSKVGELTVTASTDSVSESRKLKVLPSVNVAFAEAPQRVFEGEKFEICGDVGSQINPKVFLIRDGKIVASKNAKGEVCFERTATGTGDHVYEVAALVKGMRNSASTTVQVLETKPETRSFPDKIASVESGSGMVKVTLYNTHHRQTRYHLTLENLPDTWTSQSSKEVILDPGEERKVYFYVTPREEGSYDANLKVESRGTLVHQEEVHISSGGTTDKGRSWFGRVLMSLPF